MNDFVKADLLVELGCEELPPKSLDRLAVAFFEGVCSGLEAAGIGFDRSSSRSLHTPRRLAVLFSDVAAGQPDRVLERRGPALGAAFDASGEPTRAALGFAGSVGRTVTELETMKTDKGEWLYCKVEEPGKTLQELIFPILQKSLDDLPVARPMRWASHDFSFVRPVHWLVVMHGVAVLEGSLFGHAAGRMTRGHRIHSPGPHELSDTGEYENVLEAARVLVNPATRRSRVRDLAIAAGQQVGGRTRITDSLLDEVNNLVEWPVAITCKFENEFLEVPQEALVASMEDHQKFFPLLDADDDRLMPRFVAITNIESTEIPAVIQGYERVIRPRLADARFFWEQDKKQPLDKQISALDQIVFQKKLGSVGDKSRRIGLISERIAEILKLDPCFAARAAKLAKCDLVTQMVGEFPELQGTMGAYYAEAAGEPAEVCAAIGEHYAPRFSGDALPESVYGQLLSLADRLDSIVGIFSIGRQPTGNKDPFALRRGALGVVRLLIEKDLRLPLDRLLAITANAISEKVSVSPVSIDEVRSFILDRARGYFRELGFSTRLVNAVLEAPLETLPDLHARLLALNDFMKLPEADSLVAANKRIGNILRKTERKISADINENSLNIDAEVKLFEEVNRLEGVLKPLYENSDYGPALEELAGLQSIVAEFFDQVMVMDEDPAVRQNRLALLGRLKSLFDRVADLSMAA